MKMLANHTQRKAIFFGKFPCGFPAFYAKKKGIPRRNLLKSRLFVIYSPLNS